MHVHVESLSRGGGGGGFHEGWGQHHAVHVYHRPTPSSRGLSLSSLTTVESGPVQPSPLIIITKISLFTHHIVVYFLVHYLLSLQSIRLYLTPLFFYLLEQSTPPIHPSLPYFLVSDPNIIHNENLWSLDYNKFVLIPLI